jgi:hypothetical protein
MRPRGHDWQHRPRTASGGYGEMIESDLLHMVVLALSQHRLGRIEEGMLFRKSGKRCVVD